MYPPLDPGTFVYTNMHGEKNSWGIVLKSKKLPKDSLEFYRCTVLLADGSVRVMGSSYIFTVDEMEEFEFTPWA